MPSKKYTPEEIIGKLREAEIAIAQGVTTPETCRRIAVSEQAYYRWRKEYGGLKTDQARRMKDLEENARASPGDLRFDAGQADFAGSCVGKLLSPARRRWCVDHVRRELAVSERRVCRVLGQHRSTQQRHRAGQMTNRR